MSRCNPFDYFFLLRPFILIPVWNFLLIGSYLARGHGGFTGNILVGLLLYSFVMGGVYILNQITDRETDRRNRKLFLLSEGIIPLKHAYVEMFILWIFALVLSVQFGVLFVALIAVSILLGICYSLPPIKLKGKPVLDVLANGFGYGMINCLVGWLLVRGYRADVFYWFFPYVLSISGVFINTAIVDIKGDRQAGEHTTAVLLGVRTSYVFSTLCMAGAIFLAYMNRDMICLIPATVSFPLFVYLLIYAFRHNDVSRKATIVSFRLPGLLFTIMTVYLYPMYLFMLVIVFVALRLYYKKRFNLVYPSLSGG